MLSSQGVKSAAYGPLLPVRYLNQVGSHCGDEGGVVLHHGGEAHHQLGLAEPGAPEHHVGLLTPGDKVAVVFHLGHHVIDLLHGIPAEQGGGEGGG